jgi:hypothetical protein
MEGGVSFEIRTGVSVNYILDMALLELSVSLCPLHKFVDPLWEKNSALLFDF